MQSVSNQIQSYLANASGIRKMFEAGLELRKQYGDDQVYDFSLGNPDLPPPPAVKAALEKIAARADRPFALGYMPNAGYPELREKLAARLSREQGVSLPGSRVILTCGAAGGLNALFRSILSAGDEVLTPTPYFVEYDFYAANAGGVLRRVPTRQPGFELDLAAFEAAFSERTRAVILNSPNNPTGRIYRPEELAALAELVRKAERKFGRAIFVVSDEPYRFLNFDGVEIPSVFRYFEHSAVIGSYSKSLSLAGERLGYVAVNPALEDGGELINALILCNRILGFVNAPAIAQQILLECLDCQVDLEIYRRRRDAMAAMLDAAGIEYQLPAGAFYFFPKTPTADERELVEALLQERILAVPGRSFGTPGYIRLAFCVEESVIAAAAPGFRRAAERCRRGGGTGA